MENVRWVKISKNDFKSWNKIKRINKWINETDMSLIRFKERLISIILQYSLSYSQNVW